MTQQEFVSLVTERTGLSGPHEAERTARAVLDSLVERLDWHALQASPRP